MGKILHHRGPDDVGIYADDSTGLAHTRLSIIDLEGGHQPLYAKNNNLILIANGEIYNYIELREELESKGHQFVTHSDCEVILHAYMEYGERFLDHIFGMFAFAMYDKNEKTLILARDRLGIKPLFLAHTNSGLAFSSEIKAFLPLFDAAPEINPLGLLQYLQNQFNSGEITILKGVERILPGEAVCIRAGKILKRWRYWSATHVKPISISMDDAQSRFNEIMEIVMKQHVRSDVPYGLFLSGGLDSSSILTLLSKYGTAAIHTYSVGFPNTTTHDELSLAQMMSDRYGSQHTILTPSKDDLYGRFPYCIWAADDLMRDNANLPTALLAEEASKKLKVVFTGEGGDEVFAGYGRYRKSGLELWLNNLLAPGSGGFRTRGTFRGNLPNDLFNNTLLSVLEQARQPFIDAWQETPDCWNDLQRMQYTDLSTALPDNLLVKADRMLMGWGVEGRVPFLDHRVVEFGLSLPKEIKIKGSLGKLFMRHWATDFLPEDHIWQKKKGFSVPLGEWMKGGMLDRIREVLPNHPAIAQWFNEKGVLQIIDQHQHGKRDVSRFVLALLQFAIWHTIFIDNRGTRPENIQDPVEFLAG